MKKWILSCLFIAQSLCALTTIPEQKEESFCGPSLAASSFSPCKCGYGWELHVGPVYQAAAIEGTEFAYTNGNTTGSYPLSGDLYQAKLKGAWGVQVGLCFLFPNKESWALGFDYFYLLSKGNKTASGLAVIPTNVPAALIPGQDYIYTTEGTSSLSSSLNELEAALSRPSFWTESLSVTPKVGIKTAWISLKQNNVFEGGVVASQALLETFSSSKFWGIGPMAGLGSTWDLGCGFSLFGNFSGAVFYGSFKATEEQVYNENQRLFYYTSFHKLAPTMRANLGFSWGACFDCDCQRIDISLGYDAQYFWNQNQMMEVVDTPAIHLRSKGGGFGLQGLILDFAWSF